MPLVDIPDSYLGAAPIIVTSPTTRCGTTLVQRLLCASQNAFVYGEEIGRQMQALTAEFSLQIRYCEDRGAAQNEDFARALAGVLTDWRPGLGPPTQVVLQAWSDTYFQLPMTLAAFGESIGRPIWGFKWPACPFETTRTLLSLMPRARVVYVLRNPVDALKSAKARRFITDEAQAAAFCAQWTRNTEAFLSMRGDDRLLILPYELLLQRRDEQLAVLSRFTGARDLQSGALEVKVNTFVGVEADGHAPGQYIPPAELTAAERAAVFDNAAALMQAYYPDLAASLIT